MRTSRIWNHFGAHWCSCHYKANYYWLPISLFILFNWILFPLPWWHEWLAKGSPESRWAWRFWLSMDIAIPLDSWNSPTLVKISASQICFVSAMVDTGVLQTFRRSSGQRWKIGLPFRCFFPTSSNKYDWDCGFWKCPCFESKHTNDKDSPKLSTSTSQMWISELHVSLSSPMQLSLVQPIQNAGFSGPEKDHRWRARRVIDVEAPGTVRNRYDDIHYWSEKTNIYIYIYLSK